MNKCEAMPNSIDIFRGRYLFLSNFYPTKIVFEDITYYNAEAAYQAQKCPCPNDRIKFSRLSADEAKRLGSKITPRLDWDIVKRGIMERVIHAKFTQNPILAIALLKTGSMILREGNRWQDRYWGVDIVSGEGENHLGNILMSLRNELNEGQIRISGCEASSKQPASGIFVDDRDITLSGCECLVVSEKLPGADTELLFMLDNLVDKAGVLQLLNNSWINSGYILRVQGPKYPSENCRDRLAGCYTTSLEIARQHGIHSIAFPPISTGRYSYPIKEACSIAVTAVNNWLKQNSDYEQKVVFSCVETRIYDNMIQVLKHPN